MLSCAWLWMYAGALMMLAELAAPGFVIFFFGLAAMTVGGIRFVLGDAFTTTWQLVVFSAAAIAYLVVLRRLLKQLLCGRVDTSASDFDRENVGRLGRVTVAIDPPLAGRVVVGDAEWNASAATPLAVGTDVRVVDQNNLTLTVEAVGAAK